MSRPVDRKATTNAGGAGKPGAANAHIDVAGPRAMSESRDLRRAGDPWKAEQTRPDATPVHAAGDLEALANEVQREHEARLISQPRRRRGPRR